jgi:hypothetical protein
VLAADKLMMNPRLYATFLLWLLSELFEELPEVGDPDKPKLVFFFDEAHLLFDDAPKALVDKVEQVVRLIRSKGVGVYFVTQNPLDVPEAVLAQLGNRVQHALRAYHAARAEGRARGRRDLPAESAISTAETAITELGVGEALVSLLVIKGSTIYGHYEAAVDRESAYELLREAQNADPQAAGKQPAASAPQPDASSGGWLGGLADLFERRALARRRFGRHHGGQERGAGDWLASAHSWRAGFVAWRPSPRSRVVVRISITVIADPESTTRSPCSGQPRLPPRLLTVNPKVARTSCGGWNSGRPHGVQHETSVALHSCGDFRQSSPAHRHGEEAKRTR